MTFGEPLRDPFQDAASLPPGGLGIVFVQAADVNHLIPEPLERGLRLEVRKDELRPLVGRPRRHAPVDRSLVDNRHPFLHTRIDVAAEPLRIQIVEEVRLDRTAEGDRRAALLAELQRPLTEPRRDEVEHVIGRVLDALPFQVRIPVMDVHEFRAALVRARRDRARELFFPEPGAEVEDLTLLHVGAEVDEQVG